MAYARLSTELTRYEARPIKFTDPRIADGRTYKKIATIEIEAADNDGDVFGMVLVHSSWLISSILLANDGITGGTAYDIGLYRTTEDGGAAVDDDLFASALSMASARAQPTEVGYEARDIDTAEQWIWQLLGLSEDPEVWYVLALTADTVGSAAGTISVWVEYKQLT